MSCRAQGEACVLLAISTFKMRGPWRRCSAHFESADCTRLLCTIYFIKLGILSGPRRGVRVLGNQHFQNARHLKEVSRILKVLIAQDFFALFILSNWVSCRAQGEACVLWAISTLKNRGTWRRFSAFLKCWFPKTYLDYLFYKIWY